MDQGRYAETAALFTEDATWVRGGKPVEGRSGILASLNQRPTTDISRHLVTNVLVQLVSADEAEATACFVPLRGARREDGSVAMPPITNVGDLSFRFRRKRTAAHQPSQTDDDFQALSRKERIKRQR